MATEGTKFQINYKLNDGTLINLYAATATELEAGLADLAMNAANIRATGAELSGGAPAPTVAAVAQSFNATPVVATKEPNYNTPPVGNTCRHGAMTLRSGVGQKGPWSGYMCAAPKGAPDKCDTIWVRQQVREPSQYEAPSCATIGGDFWFPDKEQESISLTEAQYAKSICMRCPHRKECAEWGIRKENFGIWGGLSPRERFRIRQQRGIRLNQEDGVA